MPSKGIQKCNAKIFRLLAVQLHKLEKTTQQHNKLFICFQQGLICSALPTKTENPPKFTKGCTSLLNVTKIFKTFP